MPERTPSQHFRRQQSSAEKRGIAWGISFGEWWRIWQESGRWPQRGRRAGQYVMARCGDTGPYCIGNVYITTCVQNTKDYYQVHGAVHSAKVRKANLERSLRSARGWTFVKGTPKPYQVMYSKRYVGSFATQAEAESVHRQIVRAELARA